MSRAGVQCNRLGNLVLCPRSQCYMHEPRLSITAKQADHLGGTIRLVGPTLQHLHHHEQLLGRQGTRSSPSSHHLFCQSRMSFSRPARPIKASFSHPYPSACPPLRMSFSSPERPNLVASSHPGACLPPSPDVTRTSSVYAWIHTKFRCRAMFRA